MRFGRERCRGLDPRRASTHFIRIESIGRFFRGQPGLVGRPITDFIVNFGFQAFDLFLIQDAFSRHQKRAQTWKSDRAATSSSRSSADL